VQRRRLGGAYRVGHRRNRLVLLSFVVSSKLNACRARFTSNRGLIRVLLGRLFATVLPELGILAKGHCARGWEQHLLPEIERQQTTGKKAGICVNIFHRLPRRFPQEIRSWLWESVAKKRFFDKCHGWATTAENFEICDHSCRQVWKNRNSISDCEAGKEVAMTIRP